MSALQCAVGLPNVGDYGDPSLLVELAKRAEDSGWDGVFIWDHVAYRERGWPVADPYVTVSAIAAVTSRIRLGVLVSALARRRPWKFARETATLDVLSGGRLVVGIGLGSQPHEEFAAFGEDPDPRVRAARIDEGLEILTGLWTGEPFAFQGHHFRVQETVFLPRPHQRPRPPIWVAGRWPARPPFRRAARFDGVFPTFDGVGHAERPTPDQLRAAVQYTLSHRDVEDRFDVVLEAQSEDRDPELVAAYVDAGLTWWVEKLGWLRGPIGYTTQRIERGPPTLPSERAE
jgi:alkanesulfonate monooxygenase SsuD/methylene tetrahydromethanopterin reductase-like flavin-dependent oxidoreductase (luciferase family)